MYFPNLTMLMVDLGVLMADAQFLCDGSGEWFVTAEGLSFSQCVRNLQMDFIQAQNKTPWNGLLIFHSALSFSALRNDLTSLVRPGIVTHTCKYKQGLRHMYWMGPGSGVWMQWAVRMGNGGQYVSWDHGGWILHCEGDETWRATGRWRHWGREQPQPNALLGT